MCQSLPGLMKHSKNPTGQSFFFHQNKNSLILFVVIRLLPVLAVSKRYHQTKHKTYLPPPLIIKTDQINVVSYDQMATKSPAQRSINNGNHRHSHRSNQLTSINTCVIFFLISYFLSSRTYVIDFFQAMIAWRMFFWKELNFVFFVVEKKVFFAFLQEIIFWSSKLEYEIKLRNLVVLSASHRL